jgi:hypothetical protein
MLSEPIPDLTAVIVPADTADGIREDLKDVDRNDQDAFDEALERRDDRRLAEARAAGVRTDVADWRVSGEWIWRP